MNKNSKEETYNFNKTSTKALEFESSTPVSQNVRKRFVIPDVFSPVVATAKKQPTSRIPRLMSNGAGPSQAPDHAHPAKESVVVGAKPQCSDDRLMIAMSDDSDDDLFGTKKKKGTKIGQRNTSSVKSINQKVDVLSNKKRVLEKANSSSLPDESLPLIQKREKLQKVAHTPEIDSADDEGSDNQQTVNRKFEVSTKKSTETKTVKPKSASTMKAPSKTKSKPMSTSTGGKTQLKSPLKSKVIHDRPKSPSFSPVQNKLPVPRTPTKSPFITKKDLFLHSPRASDIQIKSPSKKSKSTKIVKEKTRGKNVAKSPSKTSPAKVTLPRKTTVRSNKSIKKSNSDAKAKPSTEITSDEDSDSDSIFGIRSLSKVPHKNISSFHTKIVPPKPAAKRKVPEKSAVQPDNAVPGSSSEYNYPPVKSHEMRVASSGDERDIELAHKKSPPKRKKVVTKTDQKADSPKKKENTKKVQSEKGKGSKAGAKQTKTTLATSSFSDTPLQTTGENVTAKKKKRKSLCMPSTKRKTTPTMAKKSITPKKNNSLKEKVIEKPKPSSKRSILNDIDNSKKTQKPSNQSNLKSATVTKKGKNNQTVGKKTADKQQTKRGSTLLSSEEYQAMFTSVFGQDVSFSENETSNTANATVVAKKRKSATPTEVLDDGLRRSKRVRAPPLAYWEGEKMRVVETENGEEEYEFVIPKAGEKSKELKTSTKTQSKAVHPTVNKFLQRMAAAMDRDEVGQNDDSSIIPETSIQLSLDPKLPHVKTQCQIIAHVQDLLPLSKNTGTEKQDDGIRYATTLKSPWLDCGFMRLNPGVTKGTQLSEGRVLTFMVHSSQVEVQINENKSILKFGYTFVVPPGITYNITNCGRQPALLSYQSIHNPRSIQKESTSK